jgi:hypothetical protein
MRKFNFILIVGFIVCFSFNSYAQKASKKKNSLRVSNYRGSISAFANKRYFAIGGGINILNYFGDLAPKSTIYSTDIKFTRPGISLFAEYKYSPRVSGRLNLEFGTLSGDDFESADPNDDLAKYRYIRNMQFRNRIVELSFLVKIDLLTNRGTYLSRPVLNPYFFGGIGALFHNPKAIAPEVDQLGNLIPEAGEWVALQPLGTEGQYSDDYNVKPYSKVQISLPIGIGLSYKISDNLDLSFEIGYRILFFDYIDDVSGNYVDLGALDNPLTKALSDRSQEPVAAKSKELRDFENVIWPNTTDYTYTSPYDGNTYTVFAGYGTDTNDAIRGNANDNDIYFVTSFKLTYILGGTFRNAKFR